jgi:hypothetical protein
VDQGWQTVEIDGRRFAVRHVAGPGGAALEVERAPAEPLRLRPWQLTDHLAALDRHTHDDGHGPRLDPAGLAVEVLARTSEAPLDAGAIAELAPLALWWAGGGDQTAARPAVRPWSSLARARALDECSDPTTGALRAGSYLRAMVSASGEPIEGAHGAAARALLDAVAGANAPLGYLSDGPGSRELARATLRLCRGLGWTPGQVWSTPAAELDHLLALLDQLEAPPRPTSPAPRRSGLAAHPDAVIIEVGEG